MTFSGIMAPTGTPYDKAIYMPILTFYGLGGHDTETLMMATDESLRTVSGGLVKFRRILQGRVIHPDILLLKKDLSKAPDMQLVVPGEVLPRLFAIIGWVDKVFFGISMLVLILSAMFLFVSLYWALRERRRNIALMRALGATRTTVFSLILTEAFAIAAIGAIIGLAAAHALLGVGVEYIRAETGVMLSASYISIADLLVIPGAVFLALLTGIIPAVQAYRLGVLKNLTPIS